MQEPERTTNFDDAMEILSAMGALVGSPIHRPQEVRALYALMEMGADPRRVLNVLER